LGPRGKLPSRAGDLSTLGCEVGFLAGLFNANQAGRKCRRRAVRNFLSESKTASQNQQAADQAGKSARLVRHERRALLDILDGLRRELARLGTVIVSEPNGRARLQRDGDQPVVNRLRGYRLDQMFVDAEPSCLEHAPALAKAAEHDDGDVGHRKHARRTHDAHKLGAAEERHLPVEDHHVGADGANSVERGNAVARFVDIFDAAIDQEIADHLAHVLMSTTSTHSAWMRTASSFFESFGDIAGPTQRSSVTLRRRGHNRQWLACSLVKARFAPAIAMW